MAYTQFKRTRLLGLLIAALLLVACDGGGGSVEENTGPDRDPEITVINQSGQNLFSLIITVSRQEIIFQNVPDGESAVMTYQVTEDGRFDVRGFLQDGSALSAGGGVVSTANNANQNDVTITVGSFGLIVFEQ